MNVVRYSMIMAAFVVGWLGLASAASAATFRTCIKWEVQTADSGRQIPYGPNAGATEDRYPTADQGVIASAVGVRIRIQGSGFDQTFDTEPNTGCVTWSDTDGKTYSVRVYAYQTDAAGNYVRMHTHTTNCSSYPGSTYSALLTGYNPTAGGTNYLYVGDYVPYWTGQAMVGYGLYRYHGPLQNKAIHVSRDTASDCYDSAHYGNSNGYITSGRHCIRLSDCGTKQRINMKFVANHELGHAMAALHYGSKSGASNGGEPNADPSWSGPVDQNRCLNGGSGYDITDVEYNSIGFREGFAHFYSARVFNDKSTEGAFNWMNHPWGAQDLERYDWGQGTSSGGELENICCNASPCRTGNGIIGDWLRFFWDWYTNQSTSCPYQPDGDDMLELYAQTRLEGNLQKNNYFGKMQDGAQNLPLPACLKGARFDAYAAHNGIDNE
ncbi:MAG: hypothetical protein D6705_07060 [Deltaproteobacteria bacterium]|nr:MAG: hypothetical protein D6705_07060 [Deltaproteobacteria bacterium]